MLSQVAIALFLLSLVGSGSPNVEAGDAADQGPAPARTVLVVAKIKEEEKRRSLEQKGRMELKEKGVEATLGSDVMTETDFASEDTIRQKVESLGVDGVLGFVVLGIDESVKTSSAHLNIGVGGYGGGGLGVFVGGSVPIGGQTKVIRTVHVRARFFARPFASPAWEKVYSERLEADTTRLTEKLAYDAVKNLKKKKLIPAK
jgi:hypothetical protein